MGKNERGVALVTALVLGLVALTFIGALLYLLTTESGMSGTSKRYSTALEAAKGAANFIMANLQAETLDCKSADGSVSCKCTELDENLHCPTSNAVEANVIDLGPDFNNLDGYKVSALLLAKEGSMLEGESIELYSIKVFSQKAVGSQPEKAEIDFVYKITTKEY